MHLYWLWVCVSFNQEFHCENGEKLNFSTNLHLPLLHGHLQVHYKFTPHFCELDIMWTCSKTLLQILLKQRFNYICSPLLPPELFTQWGKSRLLLILSVQLDQRIWQSYFWVCMQRKWYGRDICTPMFIAALFTTAKIWKPPKCSSTGEYIKNMWYIYNGIWSNHRKEILPFVTIWMDLEGTMLNEISETEKDKYCMVSLLCGMFQKKVKIIETE